MEMRAIEGVRECYALQVNDTAADGDDLLDAAMHQAGVLLDASMWNDPKKQAIVAQQARGTTGNIMASIEMAIDIRERYVAMNY